MSIASETKSHLDGQKLEKWMVGQLAGNHFLTVVDGREQLREMGRLVLWEGAQEIVFERM